MRFSEDAAIKHIPNRTPKRTVVGAGGVLYAPVNMYKTAATRQNAPWNKYMEALVFWYLSWNTLIAEPFRQKAAEARSTSR